MATYYAIGPPCYPVPASRMQVYPSESMMRKTPVDWVCTACGRPCKNHDETAITRVLNQLKANYRLLLHDFNTVANDMNEHNSTRCQRHNVAGMGCDLLPLKGLIEAARLQCMTETARAY